MSVIYTDPKRVTSMVSDLPANQPLACRFNNGYGSKVPTRYRVKYGNRWRRVYVACYSNSGSAYIVENGQNLLLDTVTEYALQNGIGINDLGL